MIRNILKDGLSWKIYRGVIDTSRKLTTLHIHIMKVDSLRDVRCVVSTVRGLDGTRKHGTSPPTVPVVVWGSGTVVRGSNHTPSVCRLRSKGRSGGSSKTTMSIICTYQNPFWKFIPFETRKYHKKTRTGENFHEGERSLLSYFFWIKQSSSSLFLQSENQLLGKLHSHTLHDIVTVRTRTSPGRRLDTSDYTRWS